MLLQLADTDRENIQKLLVFAKNKNLKLTGIDDVKETFVLPGKQLTREQLTQLIQNSRNSGIIQWRKRRK